jgi:hypothetical protein
MYYLPPSPRQNMEEVRSSEMITTDTYIIQVRVEVLMVMRMRMTMLLFCVLKPCRLVGSDSVSEEHTASIFRPKDGKFVSPNGGIYLPVYKASKLKSYIIQHYTVSQQPRRIT